MSVCVYIYAGSSRCCKKTTPNPQAAQSKWCMEGPTHHFALGIGHHAKTVAKLAASFGIEAVIVTD